MLRTSTARIVGSTCACYHSSMHWPFTLNSWGWAATSVENSLFASVNQSKDSLVVGSGAKVSCTSWATALHGGLQPGLLLTQMCVGWFATKHPESPSGVSKMYFLAESQKQLTEVFTVGSVSDSRDEHGTKFSPVPYTTSKHLWQPDSHTPSPSCGVLKTSGSWATTQQCVSGT